MRSGLRRLACSIALAASLTGAVAASDVHVISSIELSKPFGTRSAWRFTASQGPDVQDPVGALEDKVPGKIDLCLSHDNGLSCDSTLQSALRSSAGDDLFSQPHFLNSARVVHAKSKRALLLVQVTSLHSGDGDQRVATQMFVYDRAKDKFVSIYEHRTERNNNQEVRYIVDGSLKGDVIVAEPTNDAPFRFWITVNELTAGGTYRQVLHYRSATGYGDGNPLAVIDSEMPNIEQRLGIWRPGLPLPLPAGPCPKPHLVSLELWCH